MRPYSNDFRLKIVRAYERGEGAPRDVARLFGGSLSLIQDLLHRSRQTGSVAPEPQGGGKPGKIGPYLSVVQQLPQQQPDASLAERCERLAATASVHVGRATRHRALRHLGLTQKKRHFMLLSKTPRRGAKRARPTRRSSRSRKWST